ncbi:MAG: hypothetical protein GC158_01905 [Cyanobacteria bacterium RI_101]|nr:hypothetical protein [Cyanobacteria bacterium RI_101]
MDGIGLEWFANTSITFSTTSSASAAVSEAAFTQAVNATTVGGGTIQTTLIDAFDGYNSLLVNGVPNTTANYNELGAPPTTEDGGRELVFPVATFGDILVSRKLFVPTNDSFARWLNIVTNTGTTTQTVTLDIQNNLGSDQNTVIVATSDGDATAELTDAWVTTFQNFSGSTSDDVRLGHILQGAGAETPLARISFTNGDDNPTWGYDLTLAPGETQIIMNFATGQATRDAAAAKAAELAGLSDNALQGLSQEEISQIVNFSFNTEVNEAPTVALDPEVATLPENTDTTNPVKVADIVITDDGVGTNNLSLSGADAALFEIWGTELFIKAGASLNFETNPILDVTVEVDDPAVGMTPDDTADFTLNLLDVIEGTPGKDRLSGTPNADIIDGLGGDDTLLGREDDDQIFGREGNDTIQGNNGDDIIWGGNGRERLSGDNNDDQLFGEAGNDFLLGGNGNDLLVGAQGKDTLAGGAGSDKFDYQNLGDSLLSGFDIITDFRASDDQFLVNVLPTLLTTNAGKISFLNESRIQAILTPSVLANPGDAALFTNGSGDRTFLSLNGATSGFQANEDAIIELRNFNLVGTISLANFSLT